MKYKAKKEVTEEDKNKIPQKLENMIMYKVLDEICKEKVIDREKFSLWLRDDKNE